MTNRTKDLKRVADVVAGDIITSPAGYSEVLRTVENKTTRRLVVEGGPEFGFDELYVTLPKGGTVYVYGERPEGERHPLDV